MSRSSAMSDAPQIGVWGARGTGKSSYLKRLLAKRRRVIVFDPQDEYGHEGFKTFRSVEQMRAFIEKEANQFRLALVPRGNREKCLDALSSLVLETQRPYKGWGPGARISFVVEEMNSCFRLHRATRVEWFGEICSRGRHFEIETIGASQRMAEVDGQFRGNCTQTVIFRQSTDMDEKAARNRLRADIVPVENLSYVREENGKLTKGRITFAANDNRPPKKKSRAA